MNTTSLEAYYDLRTAEFDGETYDPVKDRKRLTGQLLRVFEVMQDGRWRTLRELAYLAKASEASASARLRDLRKDKFGGFEVQRKRNDGGLFQYRLNLEGLQRELGI